LLVLLFLTDTTEELPSSVRDSDSTAASFYTKPAVYTALLDSGPALYVSEASSSCMRLSSMSGIISETIDFANACMYAIYYFEARVWTFGVPWFVFSAPNWVVAP
jgi:hypothetical protein